MKKIIFILMCGVFYSNFLFGSPLSDDEEGARLRKTLNHALEDIGSFNLDIQVLRRRWDFRASLLYAKISQADLLKYISKYIDTCYFLRDNGTLDVTTKIGQGLVCKSGARTISFTKQSILSSTDTTVTLGTLTVSGQDITNSILMTQNAENDEQAEAADDVVESIKADARKVVIDLFCSVIMDKEESWRTRLDTANILMESDNAEFKMAAIKALQSIVEGENVLINDRLDTAEILLGSEDMDDQNSENDEQINAQKMALNLFFFMPIYTEGSWWMRLDAAIMFMRFDNAECKMTAMKALRSYCRRER